MYLVGITGASGSAIGVSLIEKLIELGIKTGVIVSNTGYKTMEYELNTTSILEIIRGRLPHADLSLLTEFSIDNFFCSPATGNSNWESLIIAPCSMNTLSAIACGCSDNLIKRAAAVALKENRKLILIPRESPLSLIHLKNMLAVKEAGADIVLPVPEFYSFPEGVNDVVNSTVNRVLQLVKLSAKDGNYWMDNNS